MSDQLTEVCTAVSDIGLQILSAGAASVWSSVKVRRDVVGGGDVFCLGSSITGSSEVSSIPLVSGDYTWCNCSYKTLTGTEIRLQ